MAMLFPIFDYERYYADRGVAYCLRCETWVPTEGPFSGSLDPHIEDHLVAWSVMKCVEETETHVWFSS